MIATRRIEGRTVPAYIQAPQRITASDIAKHGSYLAALRARDGRGR